MRAGPDVPPLLLTHHIARANGMRERNALTCTHMHPRSFRLLQNFISKLEYNHTNENYFNLSKARPYSRVMDTAKQIIRDCLPIKCLEAVFLGLYLTNGMDDIERIPISFKSQFSGRIYRHIVLAVHHIPSGKFGAVGLSRKRNLMFKELRYDSMSELLEDYKQAYESLWQQVLKIWVGLPAPDDEFSYSPICWRYFCLKNSLGTWSELTQALDDDLSSRKRLINKFSKWLKEPPTKHEDDDKDDATESSSGDAPSSS